MIIDTIENCSLYKRRGTRITDALNYLNENDLEKLENGRYEIDGTGYKGIYVKII
jgi:beta-galactosidase beta subunit